MPAFSIRAALGATLAAASLLAAGAGVSAQVPPRESLEQRLQRLEDKEAIAALLERFFEYQETGEIGKYASLFAKDGELILRRGRSSGGPEGILAAMTRDSRQARGGTANAIRMRHVLSNVHVELQGDTATAQSRFTLLSVGEDNVPRFGGSGRYKDELVRENGEWKIRKRVIFRDLPLDLEGANPVKE